MRRVKSMKPRHVPAFPPGDRFPAFRDLLWAPALVRTGPSFKERELGDVMIPVVYPFSFTHPNDAVRLGRETHWQEIEGGEPIPMGQKLFLVDGEEFPLLEVRKLEFAVQESTAA